MTYELKNESEDKYVKYLMKRYGKKRVAGFLEDSFYVNN
jgi:hypothetical protein